MLNHLTKPIEQFITNNATTILTSVGVTGTVTTGVLAAKGGFKSARIIDAEWERDEHVAETPGTRAFSENVKLVWPEFIPAVGTGALTIGSILISHKINAGRIATLVAAYSMSETKLADYRAKIQEKLNPEQAAEIDKEFQEDQAAKPSKTPTFIYLGNEVLFLDQITGRHFQSTVEEVRSAENVVNHEILTHGFASLGMFYSEIGLPDTDLTEDIGWNTDTIISVRLAPEITPDGKPCINMSFDVMPTHDYR